MVAKFLLRIVVFFLIFPVVYLLIQGISRPILWPNVLNSIDFTNIQKVLSLKNNLILINSIGLSYVVTFVTLILGLLAARALVYYPIKFKKIWYALLLLPIVMPITNVAIGTQMSFLYLGLANSILGVILIHILPGLPYAFILFSHFFKQNSNALALHAQSLNANRWQTLIHVTFPTIYPVLYAAFVLLYVISFSQYFISFLIGGGSIVTYSMLIFPIIANGDRGLAGAFIGVYILSVFLVILFTDCLFKFIYKSFFHYKLGVN